MEMVKNFTYTLLSEMRFILRLIPKNTFVF
jgi:hypothetical protein